MCKKLQEIDLSEIIFGSDDCNKSKQISKLQQEGKLRKLIPRVYTSNMTESDEIIILRNVWQIISPLFPGSVLSH